MSESTHKEICGDMFFIRDYQLYINYTTSRVADVAYNEHRKIHEIKIDQFHVPIDISALAFKEIGQLLSQLDDYKSESLHHCTEPADPKIGERWVVSHLNGTVNEKVILYVGDEGYVLKGDKPVIPDMSNPSRTPCKEKYYRECKVKFLHRISDAINFEGYENEQ